MFSQRLCEMFKSQFDTDRNHIVSERPPLCRIIQQVDSSNKCAQGTRGVNIKICNDSVQDVKPIKTI